MTIQIARFASTFFMSSLLLWSPNSLAGELLDFDPVPNFLQIPENITLGRCSGVAVDSEGRICLFHREKHPILCFDADGRFVRSWGDETIGIAHGMRIDRDDNLWVTDIGHHLVLKFNLTGKLLLALGKTDDPGNRADQFNKPTDIAFDSKGNIYVSDGYGNNRIMKFSADGKFLKKWGSAGKGPGQFNLPHLAEGVVGEEALLLCG